MDTVFRLVIAAVIMLALGALLGVFGDPDAPMTPSPVHYSQPENEANG